MRRVAPPFAAVAAFSVLLAIPAVAGAAPPLKPFGHACHAGNGVRFCETKTDAQRVPSFDGVPLDVDVTLPASGGGPFPTIVLLHGYGGSKTDFESPDGSDPPGAGYHYNNVYLAKQGYAVVNPSARGFGRSCGAPDSRTSPECDRGWIHFADQRFEIHDIQYLLGLLADEGVTAPNKIAVSGISYGGLQTAELAFLRDRVRLANGSFAAWKSAGGKPMHVAATWVRWASSDLLYSLFPNGRLLSTGFSAPLKPFGVEKESMLNALYIGGVLRGFIAPKGADPTADLATWRDRANAGEPYGPDAFAFAAQFRKFKGAMALGTRSVPLLVENGFTDPVFPAQDALALYHQARAGSAHAPVALQLGDFGHFTGGDATAQDAHYNPEGVAFIGRYLKGGTGGPAPGSVEAFGQGCPQKTVGFGPIAAKSYGALARGSFRLGFTKARTVTSAAGDSPTVSKTIDPLGNLNRCLRIPVETAAGRAVLRRKSKGITEIGLPAVQATVKTTGRFGQIVARVWDVFKGKQRIVDFGVYRLTPNQQGRIAFQLFGNAYRFRKGHVVKVELVGNSAPLFRASNKPFSVRVSHVRVSIPTREKPSPALGISKRTKLR